MGTTQKNIILSRPPKNARINNKFAGGSKKEKFNIPKAKPKVKPEVAKEEKNDEEKENK